MNLGAWYIANLFGWFIGILFGYSLFNYWSFLLLFSDVSNLVVGILDSTIFLAIILILSLSFMFIATSQRLVLRYWRVEYDFYEWIAANVKGVFIAAFTFILLSAFLGKFQRPIMDFLLFFVILPIFGSIGTSTMVAIDLFEWEFGESNVSKEE